MLLQQLLSRGGAGWLPRSALYDPFRRLQNYGSNGHAIARHHSAADLAFKGSRNLEKLLLLHFRYHDNLVGAQIGTVQAQRDRSAVMNRRVAAHGFFDILRINIFAADDEQVLPAAN